MLSVPVTPSAMKRGREDFLARMFLRLYAWYLFSKSRRIGTDDQWDSALWTMAFFSTLISGILVITVGTLIGVWMRLPDSDIAKISTPDVGLVAAVLIPLYAVYYFIFRARYGRFRGHPEASEQFNSASDRMKLVLVVVGFTVVFLGFEGLDGYLLR